MYNQVLTNSGAALLRDAVNAQKKIVFTRAICGSNYDMDSRGDLAAKPIEWYNGATGSISGVSAKASGLTVIAEFSAIESSTDPVKSACICVQIKKDGVSPEYDPADDVIFAAWCDDNSAYVSGDAISIKFDLPIALSSLVDDSGSTSGDFVTLDTDQTITGEKTIDGSLCVGSVASSGGTKDGEIIVINDDLVSTIAYGVQVEAAGGFPYVNIQDTSIIIVDSEENEHSFSYTKIPLKAAYSTANKTIDLTLGDGTVVRLTCTDVEENPE